MKFKIGQKVRFETRNGSPEGLKGEGIITEANDDIISKYIVEYSYTVEDGPYAEQEIKSTLTCLETELSVKLLMFSANDLNYQTCYDAHRGLSHTPEKRAEQEIAQYLGHMQEVAETFGPFATPTNEPGLRTDLERYRQGYLKRLNARLGAMSRIYSAFIAGPSNFPARQMEKRNATLDNRSKELLEYQEKALRRLHKDYNPVVLARAPIRSDEADAIEQLQAKIGDAENDQATMKAVNKIVRNKKLDQPAKVKSIKALGISDELLIIMRRIGEGWFPSYRLTNNNANIKRMKLRLASLQSEAERPEAEDQQAFILETPVTIIENYDITRLQLSFNGKPSDEVRTILKSNGFRWSPTEDAWQRLLNDNARRTIKMLTERSI